MVSIDSQTSQPNSVGGRSIDSENIIQIDAFIKLDKCMDQMPDKVRF